MGNKVSDIKDSALDKVHIPHLVMLYNQDGQNQFQNINDYNQMLPMEQEYRGRNQYV